MSRRGSSFSELIFGKKDIRSEHSHDSEQAISTNRSTLPDGKPSFEPIVEESPKMNEENKSDVIKNSDQEFRTIVSSLKVTIDTDTAGEIKRGSPRGRGNIRTPSALSSRMQINSASSNIVPPKPPTPTALIQSVDKNSAERNNNQLQIVSKALPKATLEEKEMALKVSKDIELSKSMFLEDRVGEAAGLLSDIVSFVETLNEVPKTYLQSLLDEKTHQILHDIREAADHVTKMLLEFNDSDSWTEWNSSIGPHQDVTVYTHKYDQVHDYAIKMEGNAHCRLKEIAAAFIETQLYQLWMPMCTSCKVLSTLSASRKIVRLDLDFVLLKKTAIIEVKGDMLPDGQILVTFASVPFTENSKYYTYDKKTYMILSGGFLMQQSVTEVEQKSRFDKYVARSKSQEDENSSRQLMNRSTPAGKAPTTADVYNVQMDDIYANLGDVSTLYSNNPLKPAEGNNSPQPHSILKNLSSSMSWYDAEPKKIKKEVVNIQAIFKANLLTEFVPDWIFNLAIRSAISMLIPMVEHQANLFRPGEYHYDLVKSNSKFYEELSKRLP